MQNKEQLSRLQPKDMNCSNIHCQCYQMQQQTPMSAGGGPLRVSHQQLKQQNRQAQATHQPPPPPPQQYENNNKKIINILKEQQELKLNSSPLASSNQATPTNGHKKIITSRLEKAKELARKININEMMTTSTPNTTTYPLPSMKLSTLNYAHFNHTNHYNHSPLATSSPVYSNNHQSSQQLHHNTTNNHHLGSFNFAQAQSGSYYPVDMLSHLLPHMYSSNPYMKLMSQSFPQSLSSTGANYPSQQDHYYLQNLINLILTVNSFQQQQQQVQHTPALSSKSNISHLHPPQLNLANTGQHIPLLSPISPVTHGSFFGQHPVKQSTPKSENVSKKKVIGDTDVQFKVDEHFKRSLGNDYYKVYFGNSNTNSKRPRVDENNNNDEEISNNKKQKEEESNENEDEGEEVDHKDESAAESDDANNYSLISQSSVEPQCISTDEDADLLPPSSMPTPPLSISSHYAVTKRHQPHSLNDIVDVHFSKALGSDMWNKIKQKLKLNSSLSSNEDLLRFSSSSSSVRTLSPSSASSLPASPVEIDHNN